MEMTTIVIIGTPEWIHPPHMPTFRGDVSLEARRHNFPYTTHSLSSLLTLKQSVTLGMATAKTTRKMPTSRAFRIVLYCRRKTPLRM